jgi:acetyl-CoA carboxylase biotin carboxyl carrier protein
MKTRELTAIAHEHQLRCPEVGLFRAHVGVGDLVRAGSVVGELDTLGVVSRVVSPIGGIVVKVSAGAVDYGAEIAVLDPKAVTGGAEVSGVRRQASGPDAGGLVFRAPTSGRFYVRSAPGKPAFVEAGTQLTPGSTICLLEVMKTFNRVTYAGEPATVTAVLVADGADVNAGDPLLSLT